MPKTIYQASPRNSPAQLSLADPVEDVHSHIEPHEESPPQVGFDKAIGQPHDHILSGSLRTEESSFVPLKGRNYEKC